MKLNFVVYFASLMLVAGCAGGGDRRWQWVRNFMEPIILKFQLRSIIWVWYLRIQGNSA